jgi:superfamily II DNA or RNA helicase
MIKERAHKDRKIFYVSGETAAETREEIRALTEKEKDAIIVASYGCFSTGINIRNINKIIFTSPSKSQIRVLQSIGRGLRKSDDGSDTILFDLIDDVSWKKAKNYCLKHGAERMKIYIKEQFPFKMYEVSIC